MNCIKRVASRKRRGREGGGSGRGGGALDESAPLGIIPNLADDLYDQRVTQGGQL